MSNLSIKRNEVTQNKILIIEDDLNAANHMQLYLQECDFDVDILETVTDGVSHIKFNQYSLILLDINLPDYDGFELLKFLNQYSINIPVIVVSAYSNRTYKLNALRLGASDYICKPIDPEELVLRMWVHLKNHSVFDSTTQKTFYIKEHAIYFKGFIVKLTKIEYNILAYLVSNPNKTVHRNILLEFLSSRSRDQRSLDYHIRNIRKKINDNGSNPRYLVTEYAVGYKLIF